MQIGLMEFLSDVATNPPLLITVLLTLGVILVNGWTDAPNAIATCVSTRSIGPARRPSCMAAVFNFLGVLVMTLDQRHAWPQTIYNMVDFGGDSHEALIALCAAMFAIVTWATAAWSFGIPTSESHALIAGLSGAAIALHGSLGGINGRRMDQGALRPGAFHLSGLWLGLAGLPRLTELICRPHGPAQNHRIFPGSPDRRRRGHGLHARRAGRPEIHGRLSAGRLSVQRAGRDAHGIHHPRLADDPLLSWSWRWVPPSAAYRIIKAVGMDMVKLEKYQGFAADIGAAACLLAVLVVSGFRSAPPTPRPPPSWAWARPSGFRPSTGESSRKWCSPGCSPSRAAG